MIDALYLLDTSPLGLATNPRESGDAGRCRAWIWRTLARGSRVMIPEIVDYEVRRELLRVGKVKGLARLQALGDHLGRIPVSLAAWQRAAELWAEARRSGRPTAKDEALDADLVIASIAQLAAEDGWQVVVVTDNVGHLSRFVNAQEWRTLAEVDLSR